MYLLSINNAKNIQRTVKIQFKFFKADSFHQILKDQIKTVNIASLSHLK
jgi:hypothetical protein